MSMSICCYFMLKVEYVQVIKIREYQFPGLGGKIYFRCHINSLIPCNSQNIDIKRRALFKFCNL